MRKELILIILVLLEKKINKLIKPQTNFVLVLRIFFLVEGRKCLHKFKRNTSWIPQWQWW